MVIPAIIGMGLFSLAVAGMYSSRVNKISVSEMASSPEEAERLEEISSAIRVGAMAFLFREYKVMAVFIAVFAVLIAVLVDHGVHTAAAFVAGAATSILAGYIGMITATKGNVRTAVSARESLKRGFATAINAGAVMGFGLSGLAILE